METPIALIADPHNLDPSPAVDILTRAGFDVRVVDSRDPETIASQGPEAVALITGYARVDGALLDRLPALRIVATMSAGVDMVDLDAARARDLWVCNLPDGSTEEVAVHAFAMILACLRALPAAGRVVRAGLWWQDLNEPMRRPSTLTLGLVGAGRIARRVIEMARPVFGRIVAFDALVPDDHWPPGVDRVDLDTLLAESDVVSLHVPLTEETRHLIDERRIGLMREGAVLVNVSRGGLVDEEALARAMASGRLFGAGLDVFESEPPARDNPLLADPRVVLSPHSAYISAESQLAYVCRPAENVVAWHRDQRPLTPVLEPVEVA